MEVDLLHYYPASSLPCRRWSGRVAGCSPSLARFLVQFRQPLYTPHVRILPDSIASTTLLEQDMLTSNSINGAAVHLITLHFRRVHAPQKKYPR